MVTRELVISTNSCVITTNTANSNEKAIQAVLHAKVGQHHLQTKPVKADVTKQFTWQQNLKIKFRNQKTIHFWLSDQLRGGEQTILGECVINLSVITNEKFPLFMFWKQRQTAVIEVHITVDRKQEAGQRISNKNKTHSYKFIIKSATLEKDMELIGSMTPYVKVQMGSKVCQTMTGKGKQPVWNQEVVFQGVKDTDELLFTVLDKEIFGKDDFIGNILVLASELKHKKEYDLDIISHGEKVGSLKIGIILYEQ